MKLPLATGVCQGGAFGLPKESTGLILKPGTCFLAKSFGYDNPPKLEVEGKLELASLG